MRKENKMTSCVDFIKELKKDMTEYEKVDLLFLILFSLSHLAGNTMERFISRGINGLDMSDAVSLELIEAIKDREKSYPDGNLAIFMKDIKNALQESLSNEKIDLNTFIKYQ